MLLGCFFRIAFKSQWAFIYCFQWYGNPWLLKLNLIWNSQNYFDPRGGNSQCASDLLLLGAQLTNGPSYRALGCTALIPFGFQTTTAWRRMKADWPFSTRHGTQGLPISLAEHFSELCCGQHSPHPGLLSFFSPFTLASDLQLSLKLFLLSLLPLFPCTSCLFLASAQQI